VNRSLLIYVMAPALGILAVLQSVVAPRLAILHVRPNPMLLFVVGWTLFHGRRDGLLWGFIGGLWLDIFSGGPMGASSLALMAAAMVAGLGHRTLYRTNLLVPVFVTALSTLSYAAVYLTILALLEANFPWRAMLERLAVPEVIYNGVLMLLLTPLLNRIPERREVG